MSKDILDGYEYNEENAKINTQAANSGDEDDRFIERSGMCVVTIKKIATKTFNSGAKAIILSVVNEEEAFANLNLFYEGKTGNKMFGRNMFDGILKLMDLTESKNIAEDIKGKQILVAISASQSGEYTNVDAKSFFHPKSRLTSSEIFKGETETKQYNYWLKKINEEIEEQKAWENPETSGTTDEDDDEFPF